MDTLSYLADIIDKEEKSGLKFVALMQKLFKNDARLKNYRFETASTYRQLGIDGIVENGFPDVNGKVIFQFRCLKSSLAGINDLQLKELLEQVKNQVKKFKIPFHRFILVTPFDLTPQQKILLDNFRNEWVKKNDNEYGMGLVHYGSTEIEKMLDQYPALKKYLYREAKKESQWNFKELKHKYKEAVEKKVKNLRFAGLPTAQYQRPGLLKPVGLRDIYIPLKLKIAGNAGQKLALSEIVKKQNKAGRFLVLAGPGSGKTTLTNYLALDACKKPDHDDYPELEDKIPLIIPLCDFAWSQDKLHREFNFIDYLKYDTENRLLKDELKNRDTHFTIDIDFFIAILELGMAVVIFDGLDEIPKEKWRGEIIEKIETFLNLYPDNSIWVTSRLFGYRAANRHLNNRAFTEYHLQPVSERQTDTFIDNWYKLQIPEIERQDYRDSKAQSLKQALESSEYMGWFKQNPLYLTMMVILNQFAGGVPKNRALLYGKYLELILWTWPNQKYSTLSEENPLEKRGINYQEQLRLLCAVAAHIKNKQADSTAADEKHDWKSGMLSEKEIKDLLFWERFDKIHANGETAHEDVRVFLNHMLDRTGFWLKLEEGGEDEKTIAFLHGSFIEYLYAYHITRDIEKTDKEHIDSLVEKLGDLAWEEFILFALLHFSENKLPGFFDLFDQRIFQHLSTGEIPYAWITLGRSVRDNIKLNDETVNRIIEGLLKQWLKKISHIHPAVEHENIFYTVLKEIAEFSPRGKQLLKKALEDIIIDNPTREAFAALSFLKQFYGVDQSILHTVDNHRDKEYLLPYLPIYRDEALLSTYIDEHLKEKHWVTYYNSTRQQVLENLDRMAGKQTNAPELMGYIISSWSKILEAFNRRRRFLKKNISFLGSKDLGASDIRFVTFGSPFNLENTIHHPLLIFRDFAAKSYDIAPGWIKDNYFVTQDRDEEKPVTDDPLVSFTNWSANVLIQVFAAFLRRLPASSFSDEEKKHIKNNCSNFGEQFSRYMVRYLSHSFLKDIDICFKKEINPQHPPYYLTMDFREYLGRHFGKEFGHIINRQEFNQVLRRNLNRDASKKFSRYLARDLSWTLSKELTQDFLASLLKGTACSSRGFKEYLKNNRIQDIRKKISHMYINQHLKKTVEELEKNDYDLIYKLILNEFTQEKMEFIDSLYIYLYEYLFNEKFNLSFQAQDADRHLSSIDNIIRLPSLHFSINAPFMIPFIFNFIFTVDLNHYVIKLLAHLNERFYQENIPDDHTLLEAVYDYYYENPFITYLIGYSWDFFCKRFNSNYREDDPMSPLILADFFVNAAKVSLTVERPFEGNEWDKVLIKAEKSRDLFVQISLTLYKLCGFIDPTMESDKLDRLLDRFKIEFPGYYRLIGFDEKLIISEP
jgi:hypothetical protein